MNNKHFISLGMLVCGLFLFCSCATIFSGRNADVWVDGNTERPLTIKTTTNVYENVALPMTIEVRRKDLNTPILVSADSVTTASLTPESKINNWTIANLLGFGLVGFAVDGLTGSINAPRHDSLYVNLMPMGQLKVTVKDSGRARRARQRCRHEIGLRFGFSSSLDKGKYGDLRNALLSAGYMDDTYIHYFGPFALTGNYYYHLDSQWAIGLSYSYGYGYTNFLMDLPNKAMPEEHDNLLLRSNSIMPSAKWYWGCNINIPWIYSRLAVGCGERHIYLKESGDYPHVASVDERKVMFAYHMTPLGVEIGKGNFRLHAEIGYGIEGIFSMGIAYHY